MAKRVFVGNLPWDCTQQDLTEFFGSRPVCNVKIVTDRDTGQARGFAFVEFETHEAAEAAIAELDGQDLTTTSGKTRTLRISEAHERQRNGAPNSNKR